MQDSITTKKDEEIGVVNDRTRLDAYQDLSGVTIKKLDLALWWVLNAKFIKRTFFWFLVVVGIIAWLYTFISFGYYLTIGTNKDDQMLKNMASVNVNKEILVTPQNIRAGDVEIFASADNRYDFSAAISNDNRDFYAEFSYAFIVNGSSTSELSGFIMPNEQKNVVSLGVSWPENINTAQLSIRNVSWHRINRHQIPDWEEYKNQHLSFDISEPQFNAADASGLSEKINVSEISFTFSNSTPYNYYHLPLNIFLYSFDRIVGIYQASLENVASGEVRNVKLNYPGAVDKVDRISVVPDLNIMKTDIYFKFNAN